jgi:hypothetical protein
VITQTSELTHCRKSRLPVGAGVVPVMDGRTHSSEEPPAKRVAFCFGYVGLAVERLGFQPRGRLCFPQALLRAWSITGASPSWQFRWKMPGSVQVALVLIKEIEVGELSVPDEPI